MFYGCKSLKVLDLSNFNTNKVTNMNYMFYNCSSLKELNINNFNTKNLMEKDKIFGGCSNLNEIKKIKKKLKINKK